VRTDFETLRELVSGFSTGSDTRPAEPTSDGLAARRPRPPLDCPGPGAPAADALDAAQTASGDCSATTSTASFGRGGSVDVEVRCRVGLSDLGLVFLPGATTISARATAPVDTLRGTS